MFTFRSLGSGSSGNTYIIGTGEGYFMIDAGIGIRSMKRYLFDSGVPFLSLSALFLTHDHCDHSRNAGLLQQTVQKMGSELPLYATELVVQGIRNNPTISKKPIAESTHYIIKGEPIECCGCKVTPFDVPHDSNDNVGYFIEYQGHTLCLATDVGEVTSQMLQYIGQTNQLILEANYDNVLLDNGPYPEFLRQRIRSGHGHLCNDKAAEIIYNNREKLEHVWLCHLSENNNTAQRALETVSDLFLQKGLHVADYMDVQALGRKSPSMWYRL